MDPDNRVAQGGCGEGGVNVKKTTNAKENIYNTFNNKFFKMGGDVQHTICT